jgi:hypothetical protein
MVKNQMAGKIGTKPFSETHVLIPSF